MRPCKVSKTSDGRLSQGDIYRNVHFIQDVIRELEIIEVKRILFPYVMVLTQDCDLQQDHGVRAADETERDKESRQRTKRLLSVLVAPLYNADQFFEGSHLTELQAANRPLVMSSLSRTNTEGKGILQNSNPRYHFLKFAEDVPLVDMVLDFKHYFSVSVEYLNRKREDDFVCKVAELYREHVCQRFGNFLARIGLPDAADPVA